MKPLLVLTVLSFSSSLMAQPPCSSGPTACAIQAVVDAYRVQGLLSGNLRVRHDNWAMEWDIGLADDERSLPNDPDTVFLIASISKGFVAAAVLKLEEEGRLLLTDPLHAYLPEYPRRHLMRHHREVTLFDLLTHTSGVPDAYSAPAIEARINRVSLSFRDMLRAIKRRPLRFTPGSKFEYSNTGYVLLGEVVHRVSGMPYGEFLRRNFLRPLGLSHTSVGPPRNPLLTVAREYEPSSSGRIDRQDEEGIESLVASDIFADCNIYASAPDLEAWVDSVTSGEVLSEASTVTMLTPYLDEYGLGWIIYTDEHGRRAYEHSGQYDAFQSWVRRYPDEDTTVTWLGNQEVPEQALDSFIDAVAEAALGGRNVAGR